MKELSIEEKAKAYDKAIERVKKLLSRCTDNRDRRTKVYRVEDIESIFPELKESEDEKIRKVLIRFHKSTIDIDGIKGEDIIAWLEKQGNNLVKNGYTKNKDYIRYADRYSHEIWRKLMDNFKNIKDYHIGCNDVSDIVLNAIIDTFNWLEKGGDKNKVSKHVEAINEEKVDTANKVEPKDYSSIDPHFFKTTDKVEPKFKVGDWVIDKQDIVHQIANVIENVTNHTYSYDIVGGGYFNDNTEGVRLWTIQDAKDGDVLYSLDSKQPFIFKHRKPHEQAKVYCGINIYGKFFVGNTKDCIITTDKYIPATKDQRDTLERAMTGAGYTFNFEKKELKKLGQSEVTKTSDQEEIAEIPFGAKESELQEATYFIPKGFHAEIDDDKVVIKKGEKPTAWTEEDEMIALSIEQVMNCASLLNIVPEKIDKIRTWLKSLKQRIGG